MSRSKLVRMRIENFGCVGPEGLVIELDNIVCLVGKNNAGKSTILRAYELAATGDELTEYDICRWRDGKLPVVELWVHIPDGMANIAERWKKTEIRQGKEGLETLRLVHSRWTWSEPRKKPTRTTFDHDLGDFNPDERAGGIDAVFQARLPRPLRIGSLQDVEEESTAIIKLVTDQLVKKVKSLQSDPASELAQALAAIVEHANKPVDEFKELISNIQEDVEKSYGNIFPKRKVVLDIGFSEVKIDPSRNMTDMSTIKLIDGDIESDIKQEGAGSRRALFWSMIQVRNRIARSTAVAEKVTKSKTSKVATKNKTEEAADVSPETQPIVLPGFMLLIDEPENALHPLAIRAARDHLYELAMDEEWQVMLTTHSPYFIDPLADHTTIVRLEREGKKTTPRVYRSDSISFSEEEVENLKAILQMDVSLAEMFFGSYPIVVEGDTEYAAFLAAVTETKGDLCRKVSVIRARGKATIPPLMRIISHFKVNFGVLHDADSPRTTKNRGNPAWGTNLTIFKELVKARQNVTVRHRVSVPDFERRLGGEEIEKDKPLSTYRRVKKSDPMKELVSTLFTELFEGAENLYDECITPQDVMNEVSQEVRLWAQTDHRDDIRFQFDDPDKSPEPVA